jgi:hypothetical protein
MKFEDAGRALDLEIERLKKFRDREVKPRSRRDIAELLRKASKRLVKIAETLEKSECRSN